MDLDATVRRHIYDVTVSSGTPPRVATLVSMTGASDVQLSDSLRRLAAARVVVLQHESGEILMAPPFSAVPTPFVVESARHTAYANCAWDALGVPVMLDQTARVQTACACCGESIVLAISPEARPKDSFVVHFAVPAAKWWADIVFT